MIPLLREAWLDRVGMISFTALSLAGGFSLGGRRAGLAIAGALLPVVAAYELLVPKPDLRTYDSAPPTVRTLWDIHGAAAICMGHTHRPFSLWEGGRYYGNSGSWCPAFTDQACTRPVLDGRPFLMLWSDGGEVYGGLHWFRGGAIAPEPGGVRLP